MWWLSRNRTGSALCIAVASPPYVLSVGGHHEVVVVVGRGSLHAAYKWRQHSGHDSMGHSVILHSQADCAGQHWKVLCNPVLRLPVSNHRISYSSLMAAEKCCRCEWAAEVQSLPRKYNWILNLPSSEMNLKFSDGLLWRQQNNIPLGFSEFTLVFEE